MRDLVIQLVIQLFGLAVGIAGIILGWMWFGWQFLLVVALLMWSNNISVLATINRKVNKWLTRKK